MVNINFLENMFYLGDNYLNNQPLYHYTSVATLALILKNKTIRFNSLMNVDDLQEGKVKDVENFGEFCFASCWTKDHEESIALWNLYTPNMQGVRIMFPECPFDLYPDPNWDPRLVPGLDPAEIDLLEEEHKYYMCKELEEFQNQYRCQAYLHFLDVEYTNDENKLLSNFINVNKSVKEKEQGNVVGRYKSEVWSFQNESRYLIMIEPFIGEDLIPSKFKGLRRASDFMKQAYNKGFDNNSIYLPIKPEVLKKMKIICGPKMTESEKIIVQALVKSYNSDAKIENSKLQIRNKN